MDSKSIARKGVPVRLRDPVLTPTRSWFRRGFLFLVRLIGGERRGRGWAERLSLRKNGLGERSENADGRRVEAQKTKMKRGEAAVEKGREAGKEKICKTPPCAFEFLCYYKRVV